MRFHSVSVLAAAAISTLCACHAELPQKANNDASLDAATADAAKDGGVSSSMDAAIADASREAAISHCNEDAGFHCDGDWKNRCAPACREDQCCVPRRTRFVCDARNADGTCSAPDLVVDATKISSEGYTIEWVNFDIDNCALIEHCVNAPGWRRLLRFDVWTPNIGQADLYLGAPSENPSLFEYSACHMHYHFNTYADYALVDPDGGIAASGHKQAFCLMDSESYPGMSTIGAAYNCSNQGIQVGFADVYRQSIDCQWIDITDTPAGTYDLHVSLNTEHRLLESNYDNNDVHVPITINASTDTPDAGVIDSSL